MLQTSPAISPTIISQSHFFSILLKRSGGMPDDTTILAVHLVGRDAEDTMNTPNQ